MSTTTNLTPPSSPKQPRRWWCVAAAAVGGLALMSGAFAIGRSTAPTPQAAVQTVEVPRMPVAQAFTDADVAWCREYNVTSTRISDAAKADGLPTSIAGKDLPASAWTADERARNQRLIEYFGRWDAGLADLRARVENPTLKMLIDGMLDGSSKLSTVLGDDTYTPADFTLFRNASASSGGLVAVCERLQP
ncbi:hypothetical protein B7435_30290 [Mycolicibacterium peregrinum]|uniref:hypothetical protein n=1 Tax=Mycolicibacterium peregrinum TaxID=43304 RepID=UPI000B4C070B|nr:hypothetical protein [Mycolicibacterium peregrinum]OWL95575.1 hypothetical protein B7435_30290 [Mycolicibacterium peregrinum]